LLDHGGVGGHISHRGGSAEPEAVRSNVDAVVKKACKADQPPGLTHIFLEKLDHVGATRDVFRWRIVAARLSAQR
jgi:hypothetical protein